MILFLFPGLNVRTSICILESGYENLLGALPRLDYLDEDGESTILTDNELQKFKTYRARVFDGFFDASANNLHGTLQTTILPDHSR
jgi:hypothetical protein